MLQPTPQEDISSDELIMDEILSEISEPPDQLTRDEVSSDELVMDEMSEISEPPDQIPV